MMDAGIEVLLSMWGRWAIKRASGALGYPSVSPMFRDEPQGDSYGPGIPLGTCEADILAVDAAVGRLPDVLRLTVMHVYQRGGSMRSIAVRMGVHHLAVGKYLAAAHDKISVDIENQCAHNPCKSDRVHSCAREPAAAR